MSQRNNGAPAADAASTHESITTLEAAIARIRELEASRPGIKVQFKSGISKSGKNAGKPYAGVTISGPFPPLYVSLGAAKQLLSGWEQVGKGLAQAIAAAPKAS